MSVAAILGLLVGARSGDDVPSLGDFVTCPSLRLGLFVVFTVLAGIVPAVLPAS